jgi:hypothetical protein
LAGAVVHQRKVPVAVAALGLFVGALAGCSDTKADTGSQAPPPTKSSTKPAPTPLPDPPANGELPRGGRQVFPQYQLVGYVGLPGSPALGPLDKNLEAKANQLETLSKAYAGGRTPLPVMELIVVVANGHAGKDGKYRSRLPDAKIQNYLTVARKHRMLLLLDIQPGRADILNEVRNLEHWLKEPDVGLAFDPEWAVGPRQVPGKVFGRTTGAELDSIAGYLSDLVARYDLPQKVFVFHQLSARIVSNEKTLQQHPGVEIVKSVDGIGNRTDKESTWRKLTTTMAPEVHTGFKLFYKEDTRPGTLMTPAQVMALKPRPEFVVYE